MARPVAERVWRWGKGTDELSPAAIVDFGMEEIGNQLAIKEAIANGATAEELDKALGNGRKIQKLVKRYAPDFGDFTFHTSWDVMAGRA
jgi:hypothetical protein